MLGCLVCFLAAVTIIQIALVFWLNPSWFDRMAFWRPKPYPHEVITVIDPAVRQVIAREDSAVMASFRPHEPDAAGTLSMAVVSAQYEPSSGVRISGYDKTVVDIPPGAIAEPTRITLTPVTSLPSTYAGPIAGPAYELRIGDSEHYRFARPLHITLPYPADVFAAGESPSIGVFEDSRWVTLPSTVGSANHIVSADVPHASIMGVLNPALPPVVWVPALVVAGAAGVGWAWSPTERGMFWAAAYHDSEKRTTQNFAIHYYMKGPNAVTESFVDEVGGLLEQCRSNLDSVGMPVPAVSLIRYDCFLGKLDCYGQSARGGPLFITSDLRAMAQKDGLDQARVVRAIVAHELIHVAQQKYFGIIAGYRCRWWLEATAAYLADRFCRLEGSPADVAQSRYLNSSYGRLLKTPMYKCKDPDFYGYASFLRWLDGQQGNGAEFVRRVNDAGEASLSTLDSVSRSVFGGQGLGDEFTRFAQDFYHDDLWSGETMPSLHSGTSPRTQAFAQTVDDNGIEFAAVTRATCADQVVMNAWSMSASGAIPSLSAQAFIMNIEELSLPGKIVLNIEQSQGGTTAPKLYIGTGILNGKLPSSGENKGWQTVSPSMHIIDGIEAPDGIDRVTLLAVNPSLTDDASGITVQRWLLIPPELVASFRQGTGNQWHIGWKRSELANCPQIFAGYNVYRRKAGEDEKAYQLVVAKWDKEFYDETAPDAEDYVYTASVVDQSGNESHKAEVTEGDPFQGLWSGKVVMEEGKITEPMMKWLGTWLGGGNDSGSSQVLDKARKLLDLAEKLLKAGIPAHVRISREQERYYYRVEEVFWKKISPADSEKKELERLGAYTLQVKGTEGDRSMQIQLYRPDEIRTKVRLEPKPGSGQSGYTWRIELDRIDEGDAPP